MPTAARKAFDENFADVARLLELHTQEGGQAKGRRYRLEVLNKSAMVLITAFWEAYCEDLASEALAHVLKHAPSSSALPDMLKKVLSSEIKKAPHDLEMWKIADNGWRKYLGDRMERLTAERNRKLNTPKSAQIDVLFEDTLGLAKVSDHWTRPRLTAVKAREKLDAFVELRGAIAHRGGNQKAVTKKNVTDYADLVRFLAGRTGGRVNRHVASVTKKKLFG